MGPFDQIGQLNELRKMRSQALEMQKKLKAISHTLKKGKWTIKVTGDQKVEYIEMDGEAQPELVKAINEALDNVQKDSAKKMMEEGGLSNLLKGF
ncbi:MAG TPA: YbaB/EbfC family nucleoid-associated protein [Patescibacteria group bacterium]|nr:YbaB/EbfC family nucleoid-associated protein [Patescibacteria group bacterium]